MPKKADDDSRETRTSKRRGLTRAAIVAATADGIGKDGESGFSLDEVAGELGLTKPALYYYFKTREALLLEVFITEMQKMAQEVDDAVEKTTNAPDAIETFVRTLFNYHVANPEMSQFLRHRPAAMKDSYSQQETIERLYPLNELLLRATQSRIRAACEAGTANVAPRRLSFLAFTSITGLLAVQQVLNPSEHESLVGDIVEMLQARLKGPM